MTDDASTASRSAQGEEHDTLREQLRQARRQVRRAERRQERRRAEIADLEAQIDVLSMETMPSAERHASTPSATPAELERDRGVASFSLSQRMHRRHNTTGVHKRAQVREPILDLGAKHIGRDFAAAHGVLVPEVYGEWLTPDDIAWDSLPERFVIKSARGGGGVNVFPVERREDGMFFDYIGEQLVSAQDITERFHKTHRSGSFYFAEEFLVGRDGEKMPHDIKVFCFYGEPAFIEVRSEAWSRKEGKVMRERTFLADGTEIFNVRAFLPYSEDIVAPVDFEALRDASSKLSGAIRRPIERLDFYETEAGIVFGEITQNPGWPPALPRYWDRRFGDTYEDASARLIGDLIAEGHLELVYEGESAAGSEGAAEG